MASKIVFTLRLKNVDISAKRTEGRWKISASSGPRSIMIRPLEVEPRRREKKLKENPAFLNHQTAVPSLKNAALQATAVQITDLYLHTFNRYFAGETILKSFLDAYALSSIELHGDRCHVTLNEKNWFAQAIQAAETLARFEYRNRFPGYKKRVRQLLDAAHLMRKDLRLGRLPSPPFEPAIPNETLRRHLVN